MTPRLPLALLAVAALASPASAATVRPGVWTGYGSASVGFASLSGSVAWADGATSSCSAYVNGVNGSVSCGGGVAFSASCVGTATDVSVTLTCLDTARRLHVEVVAAVVPVGPFAGTITYERV
jgi:hypothetical protein